MNRFGSYFQQIFKVIPVEGRCYIAFQGRLEQELGHKLKPLFRHGCFVCGSLSAIQQTMKNEKKRANKLTLLA